MSFDDDWIVPTKNVADDDLTPPQRAAVEHFEGPLLVLAGPGSGKTRVITRRIARLIERGVRPWEILAITFTNKAAREMAERVQALLPGSRIWVSTFHRFCARLLRERGGAVGLKPNFSIFDTGDQQQVIKQVLHDLNLDATHFPAAKLGQRISQAKNDLLTPEQYLTRYGEGIGTHLEAVVAKVYPLYQKRLLDANAVDFDDLLVHIARMLADNEDLRHDLDQRYRFILVDEYQDTNRAQYQIVASLSQLEPNLCATGDPDQSIYGWRGARIENILQFERDFPDVNVIRLEDNFRSTPEILATADALIAHNVHRKAKCLHTNKPSGEPVELRLFADGQAEATGIANEIRAMVESGERQWKDFAVFYRVNSLSRSLETAFARQKIPHQIAGGVAFFERMEVKDLLAYLRLIENPQDRVAFQRIVNTPTRGIGKSSLNKLISWADAHGTSFLDAARQPGKVPDLPKKAAVQLRAFASLIDELAAYTAGSASVESGDELVEEASAARGGLSGLSQFRETTDRDGAPPGPVEALLRAVLRRTGYARQFEDPQDEEDMQRRSNIDELVSAARLFDLQEIENEQEPTLGGFLETASLAQDIDSLDEATGAVTLMTLHAAKGLEFPVVYIVAVEQNILPHERSLRDNDPRQLEEERRLLFVGITRAEEKLVLTHTLRREMYGRSLSTIPSDFLGELIVEPRDHTGNEFQFLADHHDDFFHDAHDNAHDDRHADSFDEADEQSPDDADASGGADDQDNFATDQAALDQVTRDRATRDRATHDQPTHHDRASHSQPSDQTASRPIPSRKSKLNSKPTRKSRAITSLDGRLTTGAALQSGTTTTSVELRAGLSVGMQVRHPRYGRGTVVDVSGMSRMRTVTVEFDLDHRRESFIEAKSPLQPIGLP